MFREVFAEMEATIPDLQAVCLVGRDGIEIDSYMQEDLPHEVLSAEMNGLLRNLERLEKEFGLGRTDEMIIRTQTQNILMLALSRDLFVLVRAPPPPVQHRQRHSRRNVSYLWVFRREG